MKKKKAQSEKKDRQAPQSPELPQTKNQHLELFIILALIAFGGYHSFVYFGHQAVPNSDFTAFVRTGHELLSFQLPSDYKRAPVLGLLQACLSHMVGGRHPDLTAGWLLNAILHPFNILLLYLVSKRIVGRSAVWVTVLVAINPWTIQLLTEPIAETTLLFFVLLTFFFIFKHSNWAYLFACVTSMVRYDGAALILAAFVMNMIFAEGKKQRIYTFIYAALAVIPLGLWMAGTVLSWQSAGTTHYIKELGALRGITETLTKYIALIWQVGFYSLFIPLPGVSQQAAGMLAKLSRILVALALPFGAIYGLCRRRWDILTLLVFFVPYLAVHVVHSFVFHRFCTAISWISLLLSVYGLQGLWGLVNKNNRVPGPIGVVLQIFVIAVSLTWIIKLIPYLSKIAPMSPSSVSVLYAAVAFAGVIFVFYRFVYKAAYCWRDVVVSLLICMMIICNQFVLVRVVGDGRRDIEFKLLADWHMENAESGEKMVTTMPGILRIFAPGRKESFIHTSGIKVQSPSDFVKECYSREITYVAWDSRLGLAPADRYYKLWNLANIAMLGKPQSVGPYEFVTQIQVNRRRFVNVFHLRKLSETAEQLP